MNGIRWRDRLLHHARAFHDLRQEHLAGAEQVADDVHAGHQRPLDHLDRLAALRLDLASRLLGIGDDVGGDALDQRMRQPRLDVGIAPREVGDDMLAGGLVRLGERDQPLGRAFAVGALAIEHDVLDALAQLRVDVVVHAELPGVDDAHRHARLDRVVEEHRVDRLAHRIVAAKRKTDVGYTARYLGVRQMLLDPARRIDEVDRVVVVLLDAGRDGEDVRVEDDVFRRKIGLPRQQLVGPAADVDLALERVGLAFFVEGHDDRRGAVAPHQPRLAQELGLALLHRNRVDDGLALHAFESGLDHRPLRRVDHHRHARDIGLAGDQIQKPDHRRFRIEHRLVHVDVDHLRAVLHLLARDLDAHRRSRRREPAWRTRASR